VGIGDSTFAAGKLQVYDSAGNHVWLKGRASDGTSSVSFRNNADNAYNGRIQVADTGGMLFQVAGSTRATIDASGHAIIPAGVTLGTAAGVYDAAKTLDDYEEGTWTPTIKAGGTLTISSITSATYTKIGRLVTVQAYINLNNDGNAASTILLGIPFAGIADQYFTGVLTHSAGSNSADTMYIRQSTSSSELAVYRGSSTSVAQSEVDGGWIIFSLTYQTNS
jgi:hypothetical protein